MAFFFPLVHTDIDWLLALPAELKDRFWVELQSFEEAGKVTYIASVERIGIRKGIQQVLDSERQLLLRLVRRRFGAEAAEQSVPLPERITDPKVFENLGELVLDCSDGEQWLAELAKKG